VDVLLDDAGDPKVPQGVGSLLDGGGGRLLPRLVAAPHQLNHRVYTFCHGALLSFSYQSFIVSRQPTEVCSAGQGQQADCLFVRTASPFLSPTQRRARRWACLLDESFLEAPLSLLHEALPIKCGDGIGGRQLVPLAQSHQGGSRAFGTTCLLHRLAPPGKPSAPPFGRMFLPTTSFSRPKQAAHLN